MLWMSLLIWLYECHWIPSSTVHLNWCSRWCCQFILGWDLVHNVNLQQALICVSEKQKYSECQIGILIQAPAWYNCNFQLIIVIKLLNNVAVEGRFKDVVWFLLLWCNSQMAINIMICADTQTGYAAETNTDTVSDRPAKSEHMPSSKKGV